MGEPDADPEVDDDPELVAFEHAIRKRNVIVYTVGGIVILPFGIFFIALGRSLDFGRFSNIGLVMVVSGVAFLARGIALARGAPMVDNDPEAAERRRKARVHTARVVIAALSFGAAAVVLVIAMAGHAGLYPVAAGIFIAGLLATQRAYPTVREPEDEGDADRP